MKWKMIKLIQELTVAYVEIDAQWTYMFKTIGHARTICL